MNYKDYFKQQLINEMAMTGRAYDQAAANWTKNGRTDEEGMNILRKINSDDIYDLNRHGNVVKTGETIPPSMGIHGTLGAYARDRQADARIGKRAQRYGDAYFDRKHLNAFHDYMASISPEDREEIINTLINHPSGIIGGIGDVDPSGNEYLEAPGEGWRMDAAKNRRYPFYPKNIGGVGGDPLFNAFS